MIRFVRGDWLQQVLTTRGTVLELLWWPTFLYFVYCVVGYFAAVFLVELPENPASLHFLGGCVSFLIIFQLNQSYDRFMKGIWLSAEFFNHLHGVISILCAYLRRGDGRLDDEVSLSARSVDLEEKELRTLLAIATEVHAARLVLAIGVALKFHFRIAEQVLSGGRLGLEQVQLVLFDLHRVRGLLLPNEQSIVDMACGLALEEEAAERGIHCHFHVCLNYLSCSDDGQRKKRLGNFKDDSVVDDDQVGVALPLLLMDFLRVHVSRALSTPWGCPERVINILEVHFAGICQSFEQMDRLITMPLPLAYLQHSKVLFLLFSLIYPLCIKVDLGFWAKVISPCIIFFALLGFELLADELENPVGEGGTDISTLELIHTLETRICKTFTMVESYHEALLEDSRRILETVGIHVDVPEPPDEAMRARLSKLRNFRFYFSWLELPRHVVVELQRQEKGFVDDEPLRSDALQYISEVLQAFRDRWDQRWGRDRCGPCYGRLGADESPESAGRPMFVPDSNISHFLCLREQEEAMRSICKEMQESMQVSHAELAERFSAQRPTCGESSARCTSYSESLTPPLEPERSGSTSSSSWTPACEGFRRSRLDVPKPRGLLGRGFSTDWQRRVLPKSSQTPDLTGSSQGLLEEPEEGPAIKVVLEGSCESGDSDRGSGHNDRRE